jgi:tol-pal system protein YbgF
MIKKLRGGHLTSRGQRYLFTLCFGLSLFPWSLQAAAPVVDESDNFAGQEEQLSAGHQSASSAFRMEREANEAYAKLDEEEMPLVKEDKSSANDSSELGLAERLENLQKEVQELRGQLEVQSHELAMLKQQQLSFYKDLDGRLRDNHANLSAPKSDTLKLGSENLKPASAKVTPPPAATPMPTKVSSNPAEEQISYMAAYEMIKNKHFDEAMASMNTFVLHYPRGNYTANAHYWLGELYMIKNSYAKAIEQFNVVLKQFPESNKSPACALKIGYAMAASGQKSNAIGQLQQVIENYPDSSTAQLAMAKLDTLKAT